MPDLSPTEHQILREAAGLTEARPWGAHVGAVMEALVDMGLINASWQPTERGLQYLRDQGDLT